VVRFIDAEDVVLELVVMEELVGVILGFAEPVVVERLVFVQIAGSE
jgi:hypothetical protein